MIGAEQLARSGVAFSKRSAPWWCGTGIVMVLYWYCDGFVMVSYCDGILIAIAVGVRHCDGIVAWHCDWGKCTMPIAMRYVCRSCSIELRAARLGGKGRYIPALTQRQHVLDCRCGLLEDRFKAA